jgi:2-polyprenyl-6-methoxyphenol hydroxylase-like FAD-dependent oxidoreductase
MHPNLGQGANSALVDAAALLDEVAGSGSVGEALARYDLRRRRAVRRVQDNAALFARISDIGNMPLRWGRDHAMRLATRLLGGERAFREVQQEDPAALLALVRRRSGGGVTEE